VEYFINCTRDHLQLMMKDHHQLMMKDHHQLMMKDHPPCVFLSPIKMSAWMKC
jgi:hypothetical protein